MLNKAICSRCEKVIQENEEVYAKLNYPKHKLMVEIKSYLQKKGEFICTDCFNEIKK